MFNLEDLALQRAINNRNLESAKAVYQMFDKLVMDGHIAKDVAERAFGEISTKLGWHS